MYNSKILGISQVAYSDIGFGLRKCYCPQMLRGIFVGSSGHELSTQQERENSFVSAKHYCKGCMYIVYIILYHPMILDIVVFSKIL